MLGVLKVKAVWDKCCMRSRQVFVGRLKVVGARKDWELDMCEYRMAQELVKNEKRRKWNERSRAKAVGKIRVVTKQRLKEFIRVLKTGIKVAPAKFLAPM
eukprot:TRINITY_DN12832_c0_g1_i4.p5 TRINITY_DN12832_c0_g1~~TRINITY_DN12832_c0_g1_i4.p5  ORF type:complete len:100 (+),score=36.80 TRINITY_DN12832_c0_g1_i4:441-740(+)